MMITNIDKKQLAISVALPLAVGGLASLINLNGIKAFDTIEKPALTPPQVVFPIVWTVLYILMGLSFYLVYKSEGNDKRYAYSFYGIQLALNFLWTCLFFGVKNYLLSMMTIIALLVSIGGMIFFFYRLNKKSAYFQIPYFIWVAFASYLNFQIMIMNKV